MALKPKHVDRTHIMSDLLVSGIFAWVWLQVRGFPSASSAFILGVFDLLGPF